MTRSLALATLACLGLVLAQPTAVRAQGAGADPLAGRTIKLVVPFAPGGAQDIIGRHLGAKIATALSATVVVENKAGAGGVIAAESVARAEPDGLTLLLATGGAITITPHLNPKLPYDATRDFAPVGLVGDTPMTLAVAAGSPYRSVADVLRDARARPGVLTFASTGNGTVSHLTGELFAQRAGVQLVHVPYRGAAPAMADLLGGQVSLIVTSVASIEPMVKDGKARVLGSFTDKPVAAMQGAPTVAVASGIADLQVPVWVGVLAPVKTPKPVIDRLAAAIGGACAAADTRERLAGLGAVSVCGGPEALGRVIADDYRRWAEVIKTGGIKLQ